MIRLHKPDYGKYGKSDISGKINARDMVYKCLFSKDEILTNPSFLDVFQR